MFNLRKKKELKIKEEEEAKKKAIEEAKENEMQRKLKIKKALSGMKAQSSKLDSFKEDYIVKARSALATDNKQAYKLAKQALKVCISKQKFLDNMVANFEIAIEMNEMNKVINEFVNGMNLIADEMKGINSNVDFVKAQEAYEKAVVNNESQFEAMSAFLEEAQAGIDSFANEGSDVSDEEIDKLINSVGSDDNNIEKESNDDDEIDQRIKSIRQKMEN